MSRVPLHIPLCMLLLVAPAIAAAQESADSQDLAGYEDGFFLRTEDGSAEFVVGGLLQMSARLNGARRHPGSEFELTRMRPEFSGRFDDIYHFLIEPNFDADAVQLEEAWLGVEADACGGLWIFGRMKAPFGLEEVRSQRYIPFARFSILNQFSPAEQQGVFINGEYEGWEYGGALYNGGGGDEVDNGKEVALRLMARPFEGRENSSLENLQVGVAATYGREDRRISGDSILSAAGLPLMTFAPDTRADGDQLRLGIEAAWYEGPHMVQAEWLWARQDMDGAGGSANVDAVGAYVSLQRVLTGEDISFDGVKPKRHFRPGEDHEGGAFVAAARLSYLSADSALADKELTLPGSYTANVTSIWLGINWYLSDHFILRNSYVHSFYAGQVRVDGHTVSSEGALIFELQLQF